MIVISGEEIAECVRNAPAHHVLRFVSHDDGDVYTAFNAGCSSFAVPGTLNIGQGADGISPKMAGGANDRVRIFVNVDAANTAAFSRATKKSPGIKGYVFERGQWREDEVQIVPIEGQLFSRHEGLFETAAVADKHVFIVGLGSGGAPIAIDIAKLGVKHVDVLDHERIDVCNVVRHPAGLSDVGRLKTNVMAEMIREKNPYALVRTWNDKVSWGATELVQRIIRENDLTVCATDNRESRRIINRLCVEENKPCIFAAAFRRAYGGQILVVRPRATPCYECFLKLLPAKAGDQEVSSQSNADGIAYSDRPVPIEPGLSTDIAPISLMVTKLVTQELLRDRPSTLHTLDDDLVAPWYIWLNRREAGTDYEHLKPLGFNIDGMHILRWYGIAVERDPACPVCGDYIAHLMSTTGVTVNDEEQTEFATPANDGSLLA